MRKSIFGLIMLAMVAMFTFSSCGYERIDAGHVGIKVNLYGDDKGVDNVTEVTGAIWYNPIKTQVFEFPTFVQNVQWKMKNDDYFSLTTKDGLNVGLDISLNFYVPENEAIRIFKKYRKPLDEVTRTVLRDYASDGYNTAASLFTAEEIYSNKILFKHIADSIATKSLVSEGFIVEKFVIVDEIRLPESVRESIEAKVKAKQLALMKETELQQAVADANKLIEAARGKAEAMKIEADAERYSYEQKQRALTKLLVQQQFIEKWNGTLPTYGTVPELFKSIQ